MHRKLEVHLLGQDENGWKQGEKITNIICFLSLEKKKSGNNLRKKKLIINYSTNENPKDISNFVFQFYSKLYSPLINQLKQIFFLSNLSDNINKINRDFRNSCDELNIQEVIDCINSLKYNKFPGSDGLTMEFYKTFCSVLAHIFLAVFKESIDFG